MRKVFSIIIGGKEYDVFEISGNRWLYHSEQLPQGAIPPPDSQYLKPYCKETLDAINYHTA